MGHKGFKLRRFEEAFTSENWIVRIYRVKARENREAVIIKSKLLSRFPEDLEDTKRGKSFLNHKYANKVAQIKKKSLRKLS